VLSFVVVMIALVVLWQGIKATFNLDGLVLPNVGDILGALFQPIQEGKPLLGQILLGAALFTLREAVLGFAFGAVLGFALAVIFAHSRLLERGLMPFVVASQTVPILAIAPMVVVWLKAGWLSVAVIAAYLTFFPVTINTLRGLVSVPATALELMQSYAATRREILLKLRIPHALPYIFTALKISATASVVGAIIGELPSGIQDGLGGAIINFNQYYLQGPQRLWATNLMAALTGIVAFVAVAIVERLLVRWSPADRN
jgi:NitT/TauT family transport system permease protein